MVWSFEQLHSATSAATKLTRREREIMGHVVCGHTSREIAEILGIACRTVEVHRTRLMSKLNARNVAQLVSRIVEIGPHTEPKL